ncbi:hypothetical protein [Streptomyces sp. KR55]|uniref:hypothetical protein n=1 Tax=Streptomyces sp. KR55 TaxID=3457425 RepID=UPI003FD2BFEB
MRKYQKAAVALAMLGSVSFLGAGVGHADDGHGKFKLNNKQHQSCDQNDSYQGLLHVDDINVDVDVLLAGGNQDNSEKEFQHCGQSFGK